MPRIEALCVSREREERKRPVESAVLLAGQGIEGDAHAGAGHRQVSLLPAEEIERVRRSGLPDLRPGDFAENVIVSGLDFAPLGLGTRLRLGGEVLLMIAQIGKVCHAPCRIQRLTGDCIMPKVGLFAEVLRGGKVRAGDPVEVVERIEREVFQAVVITVSDRCSRGEAKDTASPAAAALLEEKIGAHVFARETVPDEKERISERLRHWCGRHSLDLVLTVGGTGFAPRDVTPEATREVVERLTPGLDEAMRAASLARTPHAMLSRGVSGIRGRTLIVNLPGSERAAQENLGTILPALGHGLKKLRGDPSDCGRTPPTPPTPPEVRR